MSYGQPPSKTPYGDQDFIKEDWTPRQPSLASPPPFGPPQPAAAYSNRYPGSNQNVAYSSLVPPQPTSNTLQQGPYGGQHQQPVQPEVTNLIQSLTPEDQIFMRSWRRDSFFYRVLPLTAIGSGALYFYNQTRNLPQKSSRFLLVSAGAYVLGKWSYKGELKRRLETSPSNTPFMKALRELLGVKSSISELGPEFSSDIGHDFSGFGSSNDTLQQVNPDSGHPRFGGLSTTGSQVQPYGHQSSMQDLPYDPDMSLSPNNDRTSKSITSYEELRARNRGLIQK